MAPHAPLAILCLLLAGLPPWGSSARAGELDELRALVREQQQMIATQRHSLTRQQQTLETLGRRLDALEAATPPPPVAAANPAPSTNTRSGHVRPNRMRFPFFEDLTKATFTKLSSIKQQEGVLSAWTVNGSIRFKLKDNNTIFRVSKLQDSFEDIIS